MLGWIEIEESPDRIQNIALETNLHRQVMPFFRWLAAGFSLRFGGFEAASSHVGFLVDNVALGQVFSEYFSFLCHPLDVAAIAPPKRWLVLFITSDSVQIKCKISFLLPAQFPVECLEF
jgi:hypothetical protein